MNQKKRYQRENQGTVLPTSKILMGLILALAIIFGLFLLRKPMEDEVPITEDEIFEEAYEEVVIPLEPEEPDSAPKIFMVVEEQPVFPGGEETRVNFLRENMSYPMKARESGIQGTVFVTFVIEKDGSITNAQILQGIGGGCDEEALRVTKMMPNWTPGKQKGQPVRTQFTMPIRFALR